MPPKKKLKLTHHSNERTRELANARYKRYREKIKQDAERSTNQKEKAKVRSKRQVDMEKEFRKDEKYCAVQKAIWRTKNDTRKQKVNTGRAAEVIEWENFCEETKASVSQRKRRRQERRDRSLANKVVEEENMELKKKVKSLQKAVTQLRTKENSLSTNSLPNTSTEAKGNLASKKAPQKRLTMNKKRSLWTYRVKQFMESDEISRFLPGQSIIDKSAAHGVQVKYRAWKGKRIQKRVLRFKMLDVYDIFSQKYPQYTYTFKTFCKQRPIHVVTASKGAKKMKCVCVYHSNVTRKLATLNNLCKKTENCSDLMLSNSEKLCQVTICEQSHTCLLRECSKCGPENLLEHYFTLLHSHPQTIVSWTKWGNVLRKVSDKKTGTVIDKNYQEVIKKDGFLPELIDELMNEMKTFPMHVFRAIWQWRQLHRLQAKLPQEDALIIADFSENLQIQFSEETISSHVKPISVTLFVAALYRHKKESTTEEPQIIVENINIFSSSSKHDSHLVHKCTELLLIHATHLHPEKQLSRIHRYTDGCAGQFRSRHCMRDISFISTDYKNIDEMVCNYGETSEFKNITDGLGGVVKRLITDSVTMMMIWCWQIQR